MTAQTVIDMAPGEDARSPWFWLMTDDDDLMLACFPQGLTYEQVVDEAYGS